MDSLRELHKKNKELDALVEWSDQLALYNYDLLIKWTLNPDLSRDDFKKNINPPDSCVKIFIDSSCEDLPSKIKLKASYLFYNPGYEIETNIMPDGTKEIMVISQQECSDINLIDEWITLGVDGAIPSANLLSIRDSSRGVYLEISKLLPPGDVFVPARFLYSFEETLLEKKYGEYYGDRKSKSVAEIMSGYSGQSKENDSDLSTGFVAQHFFHREYRDLRLIGYENISKPGGVLSILHEIAHGWQMILNDISEHLFIEKADYLIRLVLKAIERGELSSLAINYMINERAACLENMYDVIYGGMVHYKQIDNLPLELTETFNDHILLHRGGLVVLFLSNTDNYFSKVINIKRWMERNAWYCALRIVRMLKYPGFNIEPSMSNPDMINHTHRCLSTYDLNIKDLLKYDRRSVSYL
jgi:hypothetical protein